MDDILYGRILRCKGKICNGGVIDVGDDDVDGGGGGGVSISDGVGDMVISIVVGCGGVDDVCGVVAGVSMEWLGNIHDPYCVVIRIGVIGEGFYGDVL